MAVSTGNTTITIINRDAIARMVKDSGLTYLQLESLTGIPHSALQRYVAGTTEKIPMDRAQRLVDVLQKLGPRVPNAPTDYPTKGGTPMNNPITLNDLLPLCECEYVQLKVPLTARLDTIVTFDTTASAELDDIVHLYGDRVVKAIDILSAREMLRVELR